ncbi:hypothetical protein SAMN07250955_11013 [Arboricoccus pini]|uniref:Zinc-binding dehydrogenase n=1 Tax=Arboricoccus pini TaxID=1963835 RepID=A0A212RK71_9PROT|nr:hypothetical protein [Arboricoccus pini]SNB72859.1 hypothetical protein SAMN07250955_11013 [Arboricoccus pini]
MHSIEPPGPDVGRLRRVRVPDTGQATAAVALHRLEPVAHTFAAADIGEAYEKLPTGDRFGKLAISLDW